MQQPAQTITIDKLQWQLLKQQLALLKKENQRLKDQLQAKEDDESDHIRMVSSTVYGTSSKQEPEETLCDKCHEVMLKRDESKGYKNIENMKEELKGWSKRLEELIQNKENRKSRPSLESDLRATVADPVRITMKTHKNFEFGGKNEQIFQKLEDPMDPQPEKLHLLQDICLFGPNMEEILETTQRKVTVKQNQYYSMHDKYKIYGNYFYPEDVDVKRIKDRNKVVQIERIVFRKTGKKQDTNICIFYKEEHHPIEDNNSDFLMKVNPSKLLYGLSIEFNDFIAGQPMQEKQSTISENADISKVQMPQQSMQLTEEMSPMPKWHKQGKSQQPKSQRSKSSQPAVGTIPYPIYKSNFCLCVFTYFPFIDFLIELLINILEEIKIKRIQQFTAERDYGRIDIGYFIQELSHLVSNIFYSLQKSRFDISSIGSHNLMPPSSKESIQNSGIETPLQCLVDIGVQVNSEKIVKLQLKSLNSLWGAMYDDWSFRLLKIFDKDSLYDLYCCIMMQESVCFVCENRYVLTYIILMFQSMLTKPFGYPHPTVSIVFDYQLLQTPFTAIFGILASSKWLQENISFLLMHKQNRVIVNLNDEEIKIKSKKKIKSYKAQRLRKIFAQFYRRSEGSEIKLANLFKKNMIQELLYKDISKEENETVGALISDLHKYYYEQLLCYLPNRAIIESIREELQTENYNVGEANNMLLKKIDIYLNESRKKKKEKDHFLEAFAQKQIFSVYLSTYFEIN